MIGGDHSTPWQFNVGQALLDFFRDKVRDDATPPAADVRTR
jgi:hypothetical protein